MQFSARTVLLLDDVKQKQAAAAAVEGEPVGGLPEIAVFFLDMVSKFQDIMALCKTPVPPTPPVPDALMAVGVTADTWNKAFVAKYAADQSVEGDGFKKAALRRTTTEIRKSKRIKKKAAAPMALAALQAGRDNTAEDIAIAAQSVISNASHFGG